MRCDSFHYKLEMEAGANEESTHSYIQTEYFFYLIPCYYAIVAFVYRYFAIIDRDPIFYIKKITGQWIIKSCESEEERSRVSDTLPFKVLPASYVIKSKLSLFNSYMYLFMIVLSFISTSSMFYGANHKLLSLLYLFGFIAWYLSALILRREMQRGLPQSLWIHRTFWILAGTFSTAKMFQDYFLPLNVIINCFFIVTNVIQAMYAIYRSEDTQTLEMAYNDDIPGFIKSFFQWIELNATVRYLFKIEDAVNENIQAKNDIEETNMGDIDAEDMKVIENSFKHSAENVKQEINLLNTLPRRNIFIDKKLKYIKVNERLKTCYFILAQIGNSRFESERTIEEFNRLDASLSETFNVKNFPKFSYQRIIDIEVKADKLSRANHRDPAAMGTEHANKSEILSEWLQQIVKVPIFMTRQLLEFLNVDEERSAPFLTYFEYSYKLFCSKNFLLSKRKLKKEEKMRVSDRRSFTAYYNKEAQNVKSANEVMLDSIKDKLTFSIILDPQTLDVEDAYGFILTCQPLNKPKVKWNLTKSEQSILSLNQRIEDECKCSIPSYYSIVASLTVTNSNSKSTAYCHYIESLLSNQRYYCPTLFNFIRFNPVTLEVITGQTANILIENSAANRNSHYFQDYQPTGGVLEVLRVRRSEENQDEYTFKLGRKGATYVNKSLQELLTLRSKLCEIYKGVATIPEIDLKKSTKLQVKNKIENFLLKIQNLPKIHNNADYLIFYENSLN